MTNNIKPTVSVIIPTYNRANMIVPCIESVLAQSYPVNEIIIVDDHSTDDTIKQLNKFKDNIIILKTEKRSGAQAARNIGIKAAKSDWIAFLDSDDEWLPNKIEKQISALKNFDYNLWTVVHGNCYIKNINSDHKKQWQLENIDGENVYKKLLSKSGTLFPSILTSKQALEKINYLDENTPSYHEWDTAIRLAKYCRFIHIQEPLFIYNIHENSISKNSDIAIEGYQYIVNKHKDEIIELCGEKMLTNHLIINSMFAMNNNKNKLGRMILKQIPNKILKIYILQLFSYLRIKPIYFTKIIQLFSREK
ncbi:MAG: glycosyltransferase [Planctomycetia bacterium]|nr:glycosyltransferase [Planctomycetia bacterium]